MKKTPMVILVFSLICFGLILMDVAGRYQGAAGSGSIHISRLAAGPESGKQDPADAISPDDYRKFIHDYLKNRSGN